MVARDQSDGLPKIPAVDLYLRVTQRLSGAGEGLRLELTSPSGRMPSSKNRHEESFDVSRSEIQGLAQQFNAWTGRLVEGTSGEHLATSDAADALQRSGKNLFRQILPKDFRQVFEADSEADLSLLVESEEAWIPWEVLHTPGKDGDFFCRRYRMARWCPAGPQLEQSFHVDRYLGIDAGDVSAGGRGGRLPLLLNSAEEVALVEGFDGMHRVDLESATCRKVVGQLERGGFQWLHFTGHGSYLPGQSADHDALCLNDQDLLVQDLIEAETALRQDRPLMFLNACHAARQGQTLTGLGGWPRMLIEVCGCGGLIAPQWNLPDVAGFEFAKCLYRHLSQGRTLGEAVRQARFGSSPRELSKQVLAALAYVYYGHPNAVVRFGDHVPPAEIQEAMTSAPGMDDRAPEADPLDSDPDLQLIRRYSQQAADDANTVVGESEHHGEDIQLDGLYVRRSIEPAIQELLCSEDASVSILIKGEAGTGKTSLLWSLFQWLRQEDEKREVWFLKAGLLRWRGEDGVLPASGDLAALAGQVVAGGRRLDVLVDTADVRLNDQEDREGLNVLLRSLLEVGARLVTTSRPVEAPRLDGSLRRKSFQLEGYDETELPMAIRLHVRSFYGHGATVDDSEGDENKILGSVAQGKSVAEICQHPLTLRMLFDLYAPGAIHNLEINVHRLYSSYWDLKVRRDHRAAAAPDMVEDEDLSSTASAVALCLLVAGDIEVFEERLETELARFRANRSHLLLLVHRGVLRRVGGALRFFHQTFFEHAAARALLHFLKADGLEWAYRHFLGNQGDQFLAPIFEQMLVLAEAQGSSLPQLSEDIQNDLLRQEGHPVLLRSGLYAYMHRQRPGSQAKQYVAHLLNSQTKAEQPGSAIDAWLDFAPNTLLPRAALLLEELQRVWQIDTPKVRLRTLDVLSRMGARVPDRARLVLEDLDLLDWSASLPPKDRDQMDLAMARIGRVFLASDRLWAWQWLTTLYVQVFQRFGSRFRPVHVEITRFVATLDDSEPSTLADRFEARLGDTGFQKKSFPGVIEAHAGLVVKQWQAQAVALPDLAQKLIDRLEVLTKLQIHARCLALARLAAGESDTSQVQVMFKRMARMENRQWKAVWIRLGVGHLVAAEGVGADLLLPEIATTLERLLREAHSDARIWVDALKNPLQKSDPEILARHGGRARKILKALHTVEDWWLDSDGLLPLLDQGLMAGIPSARAAFESVLRAPDKATKAVLKVASSQLRSCGPESPLASDAYRFARLTQDGEALHLLLKDWPGTALASFHDDAGELEIWIRQQSLYDRNEVVRRHAIEAWSHLLRLNILPGPEPEEALSYYKVEAEMRARIAWMRLLSQLDWPDLRPYVDLLLEVGQSSEEPGLRDHAGRILLNRLARVDEPDAFLDAGLSAAIRPTVSSHRVGLFGGLLQPLCKPNTVQRVVDAMVEIFDQCVEDDLSSKASQLVGNKLTSLMIKSFHLISEDRCLRVLERCRRWPFELARVPLSAAYALSNPRLLEKIGDILEDEMVPERTRDLIRRHKYHSERTGGSRGYPELEDLIDRSLSTGGG